MSNHVIEFLSGITAFSSLENKLGLKTYGRHWDHLTHSCRAVLPFPVFSGLYDTSVTTYGLEFRGKVYFAVTTLKCAVDVPIITTWYSS